MILFPERGARSVKAMGMLPFAQERAKGVPWPMRQAFGCSLRSVRQHRYVFCAVSSPVGHAKIDQTVTGLDFYGGLPDGMAGV